MLFRGTHASSLSLLCIRRYAATVAALPGHTCAYARVFPPPPFLREIHGVSNYASGVLATNQQKPGGEEKIAAAHLC